MQCLLILTYFFTFLGIPGSALIKVFTICTYACTKYDDIRTCICHIMRDNYMHVLVFNRNYAFIYPGTYLTEHKISIRQLST